MSVKRDARLRRLGYASYSAYLRSDVWKATKARYRVSKLPQGCTVCGALRVDLHHRTYTRIGEERLGDLTPLCRAHHDALHQKFSGADSRLWRKTGRYVRQQKKRARKRKANA